MYKLTTTCYMPLYTVTPKNDVAVATFPLAGGSV